MGILQEAQSRVDELRMLLQQAEQELSEARNSLAAWERADQQDEANGASATTRANTQKRLGEERARVAHALDVRDTTKKDLDRQEEYLAQLQAGMVKATSEGLSGAAAEERARQLTQQSKAKTYAIMVGVSVLALVVIIWAYRKYVQAK